MSTEMLDRNTGSWSGPASVEQAQELIDYGVLLRWRNMRTLRRFFNPDQEEAIVRQFARRLIERANNRLQSEILIESALIWLANATEQRFLDAFLDEILSQPGYYEASWTLVEISLTSELVEKRHQNKIFEMAVSLICELGKSIFQIKTADPTSDPRLQQLLDFIATYLVSVANRNSTSIRLSLLHYFGMVEHGTQNRVYVNRILSRFGHTVLDHLFFLLFRKRSEGVALQYLLNNLPYVLEADFSCQKIVYETFKSYMLKKPERFCLFLSSFADYIAVLGGEDYNEARRVYVKHIGALLKIASEVNQKTLGHELIATALILEEFVDCSSELDDIQRDADIRVIFRDKLAKARGEITKYGDLAEVGHFRANKRGRKPSFARVASEGTLQQVHYLGAIEVQKAG